MIDLCCIAIGLHIGTWHVARIEEENKSLRDFNPGVYARIDRWQAGAYHNSQRKPSVYVSYAFPLSQRWAVNVGLVTGYSHATVSPALALSYSFDNGVRLVGFPRTPKSSGGIHVAYELTRTQ